MPLIDVIAGHAHYWRHLAPIVDELRRLDVDVRVWATRNGQAWGDRWAGTRVKPRGDICFVASHNDAHLVRGRRCIYLEHGAGQTYAPGEFGYAGARGLDHVVLFLAPGEHVATKWRAAYPQALVESVGCAALDRHVQNPGHRTSLTVAFTFHWNCGVCPESRTAFDHYAKALPHVVDDLRARGVRVIGHAHPRIVARLKPWWEGHGVDVVDEWDDVLDQVAVLVADNTSAMYEAAALDIPIVVLNAPWYRRDVEHGLRFWSHVPGRMVDDAGDIVDEVLRAPDDLTSRVLREAAVAYVYAATPSAAAGAAHAIMEVVMAPATRRVVESESVSHVDTLAERMTLLGATADEVETFRRSWEDDEWNPGEREQLIGMSDAQLGESIGAVREENDYHSQTPDEADALAAELARAEYLEALKVEAYDHQSTEGVDDILAWVNSPDVDVDLPDELASAIADRAEAVLVWEQQADRPRTTLVGPLQALLTHDDDQGGHDDGANDTGDPGTS